MESAKIGRFLIHLAVAGKVAASSEEPGPLCFKGKARRQFFTAESLKPGD